jgi:small subunit ribosomal protein S16
VVVIDKRKPRQGVSVDDLGYYNPMTDPAEIKLDEEKALKWLKEGAIPTQTVRSILSKAGVLQKFHNEQFGKENEAETEVEEVKIEAETVEQPSNEENEKNEKNEKNEQEEP